MLLSDLIARMQLQCRGMPPKAVEAAVRHVFDEIVNTMTKGGRVELRGFGVFEVRERRGCQRRNPRTGEPIEIDDRRHVHWRSGKRLAAALREGC